MSFLEVILMFFANINIPKYPGSLLDESCKFMIMSQKQYAKKLGIPIEVYDSDIFQVSTKLNSEHPCYMCARMRRGFLYNKAQSCMVFTQIQIRV